MTGASTGIGAALARRLAAEGTDLVLVARGAQRLAELAASLREDHGVDVEVLPADLTDGDRLAAVETRLEAGDRPVDLLVNNAGFGTFGAFHTLDVGREEAEVALNVTAVVRLTHAALPRLQRGGGGAVLNVSSLAGHQPAPFSATYGASKAFVTRFSEALAEETRGSGVRVAVLCPGFTRTDFQEIAEADPRAVPAPLWQDAAEVARAGLDGLRSGRTVIVPGGANRALAAVSRTAPRRGTRRTLGALVRRYGNQDVDEAPAPRDDATADGRSSPRPVALVTGASRGIGAGFARELAADGYDLVLVARSSGALHDLAGELGGLGAGCEVLPADLADPGDLAAVADRASRRQRPVDLLVSNAGFASSGPFTTRDRDEQARLVAVHVRAAVRLAHAALAQQVPRGTGGLIAVSSVLGFQPGPYAAVYSASKTFLLAFVEALHEELRGTGVRASAVCPGFTRTALFADAGADDSAVPTPLWLEPDAVAAAALRGWRAGQAVVTPGLAYRAGAAASRALPRPVIRRIGGLVGRRF